MNAVVSVFYFSSPRVVTGKSADAIAREARLAARVVGCNGAACQMVGAYAEGLLRSGTSRQRVLAACDQYATQLCGPAGAA